MVRYRAERVHDAHVQTRPSQAQVAQRAATPESRARDGKSNAALRGQCQILPATSAASRMRYSYKRHACERYMHAIGVTFVVWTAKHADT